MNLKTDQNVVRIRDAKEIIKKTIRVCVSVRVSMLVKRKIEWKYLFEALILLFSLLSDTIRTAGRATKIC